MAGRSLFVFECIPQRGFEFKLCLYNLVENENHQNNFRVIIDDEEEDYARGNFLYEFAHRELKYDSEQASIQTVSVLKLMVLRFEIDISKQLLLLWGNKKCCTQFITILGQSSDYHLVVKGKRILFDSFVQRMLNFDNIRLTKVQIRDVIIDNGIRARCSVDMSQLDDSKNFVLKHIKNITRLSMEITDSSSEEGGGLISLTVYSSGSVVFFQDPDLIPEKLIASIIEIVGDGEQWEKELKR